MAGVNRVTILGNLTKDPDMKYGQASGKAVTRFTVAVSEKWGGEEKTEFFNMVAFGKTAEIADQFLAKGHRVYIEGKLQTRKWEDNNGNTHYTTEIIVNNLVFLEKKQGNQSSVESQGQPSNRRSSADDDPFDSGLGQLPSEDDMPW